MDKSLQERNQLRERPASDTPRSSGPATSQPQSDHPALHLQRTIGNRAVRRLLEGGSDDLSNRASEQAATQHGQLQARRAQPGDSGEMTAPALGSGSAADARPAARPFDAGVHSHPAVVARPSPPRQPFASARPTKLFTARLNSAAVRRYLKASVPLMATTGISQP